jgi:hypothetical protein
MDIEAILEVAQDVLIHVDDGDLVGLFLATVRPTCPAPRMRIFIRFVQS